LIASADKTKYTILCKCDDGDNDVKKKDGCFHAMQQLAIQADNDTLAIPFALPTAATRY
jgi:hypothetical protein